MPKLGKTLQADGHMLDDDLSGRPLTGSDAHVGGKHVRPSGEVVALLPWVVEQRGQHLGRQIATDPFDPIEGLILGQ